MAELSLNDRLQPALLDRLIDDERSVVLVKVTTNLEVLEQLGLSQASFAEILSAQGLRLQKQERNGSVVDLHYAVSRQHASPAQLRALVLKPPGAPGGVTLGSFAVFESRVVPNTEIESADRRMLSMRRLRECVHRDLGWLFNAVSLDSEQDLSRVPHVAQSVLNYGLPSFAGRAASSVDRVRAAEGLRRAIELFEPRLSSVRVTPRVLAEEENDGTLEFTVEAQLWGQPLPQHLQLRTKIDVITGDVTLAEDRGS